MAGTLVLGTLGLVASHEAGKKQERLAEQQQREQKKVRAEQKKIADIKAARENRKLIREARIKKAEIITAGGEGDSRTAGAAASLGTQTASAVGFLGSQVAAGESIFESGNVLSDISVQLAGAQQQAQLGGTIFDIGLSKGGDITSAFKTPKVT